MHGLIFHLQCFFAKQIFNLVNCAVVLSDKTNLFKKYFSGLGGKEGSRQEIQGQAAEAADDDRERDRGSGLRVVASWIFFILVLQYLILSYGDRGGLGFHTAGLSWGQYLQSVAIGAGIVIWGCLCRSLRGACASKEGGAAATK